MVRIVEKRVRFYVAVEGEGDQSFVKWIQYLSDNQNHHIHLDTQLLGGGGYKKMLEKAVKQRKRKERNRAACSILLIDADRAMNDDNWPLEKLRREAFKQEITTCFQIPNQEGLLLRMMPGKETSQPNANEAAKLLQKSWPDYQKPVDAYTLSMKFTLDDLTRVARLDQEIKNLLLKIGLLSK